MPIRKPPAHKAQIRNLLASGKLNDGERPALQQMVVSFAQGQELTAHQKLWVETLVQKYLAK